MTDYTFFGLHSLFCGEAEAYKSKQRNLTCCPPVYTELTVPMTFLNLRSVKKKSVSTDDCIIPCGENSLIK